MKKVISCIMILILLFGFTTISSGQTLKNSSNINSRVVLPDGEKMSDEEMKDTRGEFNPYVVGAVIGGTVEAGLKATDNYVNGKRGTDVLDGCKSSFVKGAVTGAITAPVKVATSTVGVLTKAEKVYDYGRAFYTVGAGVVGYVAEKVTGYF